MNFCPNCGELIRKKRIDDVERFFCDQPQCHFVDWDNPVPVVAAIVKYKDQILLAQNTAWPDGQYSFITGYLERYEHPELAVIREVKEELGLDAQLEKFIGHFIFTEKNQLLIVYSVAAEGTIMLNRELKDFKLFNERKILEHMFAYPKFAQSIIEKYLSA